jgi:serine/threonine protein kinase/WD40 repeat protein
MTLERWKQVKEILHGAMQKESHERSTFLDQACKDDPSLKPEVESLLASRAGISDGLLQTALPEQIALGKGARLGPYEIVSLIGAGGMGEVYRARDTALKRDLAIKVLPNSYTSDPDRSRRFQQEAEATAALNHPNILTIYQVGSDNGTFYIAAELLQGESLRDKLLAGRLTLRSAIEYGVQIARGLAAAHEHEIVHRDLKPENVFITKDGRVKILDFGLAKLTQRTSNVGDMAPTRTLATEPGVVMGTVAYMSPEQVQGKTVDHLSDVFSFGQVLYEMLAGRRAFQKPSAVETMTAILTEDPPALAQVAPNVPVALQRVVHRCLEKSSEQRFQAASDLGYALEALSDSGGFPMVSAPAAERPTWQKWILAGAAVALIAAAIGILIARHRSETPPLQMEASILPPPGEGFWANLNRPAAISPNGASLALIAMRNGHTELWLRRLDASEAQPIAGTEDASYPFWSPDSRHIGFFADGKLKKVDASGGKVAEICQAGMLGLGGAWSSRGVIVFATLASPLRAVNENGGTPEPISSIPLTNGAIGQMWPVFLPDGKHFLFLDWRYPSAGKSDNSIWIGSLDGEKARPLPLNSTSVQYASGYLLFVRNGDLFAQPFNLVKNELTAQAFPVARNVQFESFIQDGAFTVSANGILVYGTAGTGVDSELTWMDRGGRSLSVLGEAGQFETQAISPDGKRVAVSLRFSNLRQNVWIYDTDLGTRVPLEPVDTGNPIYSPRWSPDGRQVAYRDLGGGSHCTIYIHNSDGSGQAKKVLEASEGAISVEDWSPDGRHLLFCHSRFEGPTYWHDRLRVAPMEGGGKLEFEIDNAANGKFSPDGHWIAYSDDTSHQVYVTPFPGPGARIAVSSSTGNDPRWRGDGQELFYADKDQTLISVQVRESAADFRVLSSRPLFKLPLPDNVGFYDVTHDGKRFLINVRTHKQQAAPLTLVTNWTAQLQSQSKPDSQNH